MFQRKIGLLALAAGALLVALLTLVPHPGQEELVRATPPTCLICGELGGVDVVLNVILFIPLGLGLGLLGVPWPAAAAACLGASGLVELLQMKAVAGRDASLSDLVTNTAGALLGVGLSRNWRTLVLPSPRAAAGLATTWGAAWLALAAATGAGLRPIPTTATWYGQWAPELGHLDRFRGQVLSARAGDAPLEPGRWDDTPAWRERLTRPDFSVAATVRTGPAPGHLAPIVSVFDADRREVLLLGQWGDDLVYRVRMAPARLRLRNPAVRLTGGLESPPGAEVRLEGGTRGQRYILSSEGPAGRRSRELPFSPHWTWALLLPYDYALGPEAGLLTALWLFGLLFPLGWW
ncbi:MAG TPA: VanZ family protein, partial [Methylomirabilota bacterium]|nr:VanZ family protein [Methylomirabilota bacterium]